LISSGTSNEESVFVDASGAGPGGGEGEDVFFMSAARLTPQDVDSALDIYDAHVCTSAAPCASGTLTVPPACTGTDSCRSAPPAAPDTFGPPASATFHGPGNQAPTTTTVKVKTAAEVKAEKLAKALKLCKKDQKKVRRNKCEKAARKKFGPTKTAKKK
jgi:hypothetical protein